MSLSVKIGVLARSLEDPEWEKEVRQTLSTINRFLIEAGLSEHNEPVKRPKIQKKCPIEELDYSSLYNIRKAFAHVVAGVELTPRSLDLADPAEDPVLLQVASPRYHLLWHSDPDGFYVPVDFPEVLESESLPGGLLGSSHRLLDGLTRLAPALGIKVNGLAISRSECERLSQICVREPGNPFADEISVWFYLYEKARLSVEHGLFIMFC